METRYFSCPEIAEMTGYSLRTVWEWCRTGALKASRPTGKAYFIREDDFQEFMERKAPEAPEGGGPVD